MSATLLKIGKCVSRLGFTPLRATRVAARRSRALRAELMIAPGFGANQRVYRSDIACYQKLVAGIRIWLEDKFIWAAPLPGNETLLQDWDLGFGPIDGSLGV
jgi:hypothetical protein